MGRDLTSPHTAIKVLEGLVASLRAEGVDIVTVNQLDEIVQALKARMEKAGARAVRL
jgi:hypothetical protein